MGCVSAFRVTGTLIATVRHRHSISLRTEQGCQILKRNTDFVVWRPAIRIPNSRMRTLGGRREIQQVADLEREGSSYPVVDWGLE